MAGRLQALQSLERVAEADRFGETPHPRETVAFFGHRATEEELLELYRSGRLPHALLIEGPPGIGKATLGWRLARFILANPDPSKLDRNEAGGLCLPPNHPVARQVVALSHPDLILLRRTWNAKEHKLFNEIRVDDIRTAAQMFRQSTGCGGFRICILDCADDLNAESANALLKIIEEPPPRSLFLLVAHRPARVLPTIRSRCRKISLKPLSSNEIYDIIGMLGSPWSHAPDAERQAVSSMAHGSLHDALRRLGETGTRLGMAIDTMMADLPRLDWLKIHALADSVAWPSGSQDFDTLVLAAFDWLDRALLRECEAGQGTRVDRIATYAAIWELVGGMSRRMAAFNLDKRPVVLAIFAELASAARGSFICALD